MTINSIGGLNQTQSQQNIQKSSARLQAAIASLVSGRKSDDVAALSIATQLQSQVSSLKQASGNIAQAVSLAQVADGGAEKINAKLDELKSLAQKANSPTISENDRAALDKQFQDGLKEIDRLANNTTFNSRKLLDGSVKGDDSLSLTKLLGAGESIDSDALQIEGLQTKQLLNNQSVSIKTQASAAQATDLLAQAINKATSVRATIGSFQQSLNYAAANIDSAVANQEAARSILQDVDFGEASTESSIASLLRNSSIQAKAQADKLTPNILKLIS